MDNEQHKSTFLLRYIRYLNYLSILALLLSYLSLYIDPRNLWALSLFGLAYPILLLINLIFVLFWISLKKPYFLISLIAILLGTNLLGKFAQFNFNTDEFNESTTMKVLSFNVHNFSNKSKSGVFDKVIQQSSFEFIETQKADIVCLQEFNYIGENIYASHAQLKQRLGAENYYFESYFNPKKNKVFGMATFSKFPIVNKGIFSLPETRNFGTFIDIQFMDDTVRVYNIHLESISLNQEDYSFVTGISPRDSLQSPNTTNLLKKLKKASLNRTKQVEILRRHITNTPFPVIICGDFNETPSSYNYHFISDKLEDAFIESGRGIGRTFLGNLPAGRIDFILYDSLFESAQYTEHRINLSDHFPISVSLAFK